MHRDIKPANLLVDGKGVLKILDLGLARFASKAGKASQAGSWVSGTPDYIAPEQIADSPNLDGRADIYSLGLTFYFLLVGHRPFMKQTLPEILTAHRSEQPPPIDETRPDVPFELTTIFEKMTAKAPEQRYKTAGEVAEALQAWLGAASSGRPSRLSAIKAAALRSKQRVNADSTDAKPPAAASPDLELAPLEEQPSRPTVAMQTTAASTHRSRTSEKTAPAGAKREPGGTAAAKPAAGRAAPPAKPVEAGKPGAVPDLLANLSPGPISPQRPCPRFRMARGTCGGDWSARCAVRPGFRSRWAACASWSFSRCSCSALR